MDNVNKLLDSRIAKGFALILGIMGGIIKILDVKLPQLVDSAATVAIYIIAIYFALIVLRGLPFIKEEINYRYQARRYGIGYTRFDVQCVIADDGSATVIRDVAIKAFSEISELDTFINIPEEDPNQDPREIKIGKIETKNNRDLKLRVIESRPGRMSAKIEISPPLKNGEQLEYTIYDYYLPRGLFGIDITQDELKARQTPYDYFGWHVNRPTRKILIEAIFPLGKRPSKYKGEVRFAAAAASPSDQIQHEELARLDDIGLHRFGYNYVLSMIVQYPLSSLVYLLSWEPFVKDN